MTSDGKYIVTSDRDFKIRVSTIMGDISRLDVDCALGSTFQLFELILCVVAFTEHERLDQVSVNLGSFVLCGIFSMTTL